MPPTVPVLERVPERSAAPATYSNVRASAEDFGSLEGRALEGLGKTGANIAKDLAREKKQNDVNYAIEKMNRFNDELRPFLDAPDTGIRNRVGSNADGVVTITEEKIRELEQKYSADLKSPEQIQAFKGLVERKRAVVLDSVTRHQAAQMKVFHQENTAATLKGHIEDVYNDPTNEKVLNEAVTLNEVLITANMSGLGAEAVKNRIAKEKSNLYVAATMAQLERDPKVAKEFFDKNKKNMLASQRDKVAEALEQSVNEQDIRDEADIIIGQTDNYEEQRKLAKAIPDAKKRAGVEKLIDNERVTQEIIRTTNNRRVFNSEKEKILNGKKANPMATSDPAQQEFLRNLQVTEERKRIDPTYQNPLNRDKWNEWSAKTPEEITKMSLEDLEVGYMNHMDSSHWESILNEWEAHNAAAGKIPRSAKHSATLTFKDTVTGAAGAGGIINPKKTRAKWSKSEHAAYDNFSRVVAEEVSAWEAANGKKADPTQMRKIADKVALDKVYLEGFFTDTERPAVGVVDPEDRARAYVPLDQFTDEETKLISIAEKSLGPLENDIKQRLTAAYRLGDTALRDSIYQEIGIK